MHGPLPGTTYRRTAGFSISSVTLAYATIRSELPHARSCIVHAVMCHESATKHSIPGSSHLLHLRDLHQMPLVDEPAKFTHERHVLRNIARLCTELGVMLHEALHVGNCGDLLVALGRDLEVVHHALDCDTKIACVPA